MTAWEEKYTGFVRTHCHGFGTSEAWIIVSTLLVFTAIYGQGIWGAEVAGYPVLPCILYPLRIGAFVSVGDFFYNVFSASKSLKPALELIQFTTVSVAMVLFFYTDAWTTHTLPVMLCITNAYGLVSVEVLVKNITGDKIPFLSLPTMVYLAALVTVGLEIVPPIFIWGFAVFMVSYTAFYLHSIATEIAAHLGIWVFSLEQRPKPANKTN
jgi:hypothetical protein